MYFSFTLLLRKILAFTRMTVGNVQLETHCHSGFNPESAFDCFGKFQPLIFIRACIRDNKVVKEVNELQN